MSFDKWWQAVKLRAGRRWRREQSDIVFEDHKKAAEDHGDRQDAKWRRTPPMPKEPK